jgi:hypothetical protein
MFGRSSTRRSGLLPVRVSQDDVKRHNFYLINHSRDKIMIVVDLERISQLLPQKDPTRMLQADVDFLMQAYRDHLECL